MSDLDPQVKTYLADWLQGIAYKYLAAGAPTDTVASVVNALVDVQLCLEHDHVKASFGEFGRNGGVL